MDRWILSELQLTTRRVTDAMDSYDLLSSSRALFAFVDNLSNWYVRRSRPLLGLRDDRRQARRFLDAV